jgi:hypothetical protein
VVGLVVVRALLVEPLVVDAAEVEVVIGVVAAGRPGPRVSETYSVVPGLVVKLAVVPLAPAPDAGEAVPVSTAVSWSSAAVRFFSAWSSESWATVGSSAASSWPWLTC